MDVSARAEEEIAEMDDEEKQEFLELEGIEESGVDRLIRAAYHLLGLQHSLLLVVRKLVLGRLNMV